MKGADIYSCYKFVTVSRFASKQNTGGSEIGNGSRSLIYIYIYIYIHYYLQCRALLYAVCDIGLFYTQYNTTEYYCSVLCIIITITFCSCINTGYWVALA
jgi:hypothetical protein